jgi:dihydroorotase
MPPRRPAGTERTEPPAWILAGRAFVRGRLQPVEIAIGEEGRILSLGRVRTGAPRHDVGDAVIVPAATDLHVHFREPGPESRTEDLATGTLQAVLGGVTLVGEMPNTEPPVTDAERLAEKAALVPGRAATDVLLYASPTEPRALPRLAERAGAFKLYLSPTTGIREVPATTDLPPLLRRLAELDLPVAVHAEDPARFTTPERVLDPADWNAERPPRAETDAIDHLLPPPERLRLHVAHVTTAIGADRLRDAQVSFEATPHHLLLSVRSGSSARFKVNPPLRSEAERRGLWERFADGRVPMLASDHAPHSAAAKDVEFARAPSGMPGVETMLPLLLARVRAGDLPLPTLLAAACERPALFFDLPLGRLAPGYRANLLVLDFRRRTELAGRRLHAPCGWTAFEGWEAIFPREHYRDGRRVVRDGEYVGGRDGVVVRPERVAPPASRRRPAPSAE